MLRSRECPSLMGFSDLLQVTQLLGDGAGTPTLAGWLQGLNFEPSSALTLPGGSDSGLSLPQAPAPALGMGMAGAAPRGQDRRAAQLEKQVWPAEVPGQQWQPWTMPT